MRFHYTTGKKLVGIHLFCGDVKLPPVEVELPDNVDMLTLFRTDDDFFTQLTWMKTGPEEEKSL